MRPRLDDAEQIEAARGEERDLIVRDLADALKEVVRLRLATDEGTCRVRFDRAWEVAEAALKKTSIN